MNSFIESTPPQELGNRIKSFQARLVQKDLDGALIVQKTDLFYFSGTSQQGWLYIPAEGKPLLMIFKEVARAQAESSLEQVVSLASPKKIPECLSEGGYVSPARLGMELDVLPVNLFQHVVIDMMVPDTVRIDG